MTSHPQPCTRRCGKSLRTGTAGREQHVPTSALMFGKQIPVGEVLLFLNDTIAAVTASTPCCAALTLLPDHHCCVQSDHLGERRVRWHRCATPLVRSRGRRVQANSLHSVPCTDSAYVNATTSACGAAASSRHSVEAAGYAFRVARWSGQVHYGLVCDGPCVYRVARLLELPNRSSYADSGMASETAAIHEHVKFMVSQLCPTTVS